MVGLEPFLFSSLINLYVISLVPVLAVGFDDILKRMEVQSKQSDLYQQKLKVKKKLARIANVKKSHE